MTQSFRLVRYFTITGFIAIVTAIIVLGLLYKTVAERDIMDMVERENVVRTRAIVDNLWTGIEPLIYRLEGLEGEALRGHPAAVEIMSRITGGLKERFTLLASTAVKIKIFSPRGLTVFSTDNADIGKDGSHDAGFIAAVAGDVYSKLAHKHTFLSPRGEHEHLNMIESYIPIRHGGPETPIEAVFELYYDVTPVVRRIGQTQIFVIIGVTLTLLAVYGALIMIVVRADRVIRRANKSLLESEERFRSVVDSSRDAIIAIDAHGVVVSWNNGATSVFGYDRDEMIGRTVALLIPERYEGAHEAALKRIRETGEVRLIGKTVELAGRRKDGAEFPLELTLGMWKAGEKVYYSGIIRDIADRKEAERQLGQRRKMESIGNLSGGIAHEINNMLLPILALTSMMADDYPADSKDRKKAEIVLQAAERIRDLIARLLTFSRLDELERQNIDLCAVVEETVGLLRSTIPRTVGIEDRLDKGTGIVFGDASQIKTLLINLAVNSADAVKGGAGRIEIILERARADEASVNKIQGLKPGAWAKLTVRDNGCGMDQKIVEHIFDPFFTTKEVGEGTGLGLSIVHGIVTRHGGVIDISSTPGVGTNIDIYLPLIESAKIV
ncbi:MAG: hypothetical protein A3G18_00735 [Rhodospirillales bacterium RIFCSPLOWO2_12_FULL_58_28]|nr:MAG: hypothetical protein A3H92_01845 [Rhodospirillales bacterium RIFCSPLOWO2_02_FULL_58_16]OHC79507.1 MAG: hypothetical protein A3G18_00735 [Rhodospirillales bacterium RIFCSPLOWO2_12_FULL_58_28]